MLLSKATELQEELFSPLAAAAAAAAPHLAAHSVRDLLSEHFWLSKCTFVGLNNSQVAT